MTFEEFFRAIYADDGYDPFPWQSRLARQVINEDWPEVLDLPTGVGKTNALDIAIYHLIEQVRALRSGKIERRDARLRIFYVVDRRIVVDGAYRHALFLAKRLREAERGLLADARELLQTHFQLKGDDEPLAPLKVSLMRGGMYRDDSWSLNPTKPTICISTVDQFGSRLLFRGYGVSPSMRPVHAGLVGSDSLLLLDEVHLSNPFLQTTRSVQLYMNSRFSEKSVACPLKLVQMSATIAGESASATLPFQLSSDDRSHPVISQRLSASKVTRLEKVQVRKDDPLEADNEFATVAVARAVSLSTLAKTNDRRKKKKSPNGTQEAKPGNVIGIVVNRVRTARRIFELLRTRADVRDPMQEKEPSLESTKADVVLLTGRIRPADRDELLFRSQVRGKDGWLRWIEAGRADEPDRPIFVVATQTIEVGADLDFDVLVTEPAPLDCLRQRFGRLDRRGKRGQSAAFVLGRSVDVAKTAKDRVYGDRLTATWQWLNTKASGKGKNKTIDFGVDALEDLVNDEDIDSLCAEKIDAPVLLPPYLKLWSRTNPVPAADPDVSVFLHGPDSCPADVQVVWRADLWERDDDPKRLNQQDLVNAVSLLPPSSLETCSIPVYEIHRWLGAQHQAKSLSRIVGEISDVEGDAAPKGDDRHPRQSSGMPVLRWKGEDDSRLVAASKVRPGDTIVVPTSYGGHDAFGWNPSCESVTDLGETGSRWGRAKPVVRFHPKLLAPAQWGVERLVTKPHLIDLDEEDTHQRVREYLEEIGTCDSVPKPVRLSCQSLLNQSGRIRFAKYRESGEPKYGWIATSQHRLDAQQLLEETSGQADLDSDDTAPDVSDRSSFYANSQPVTLRDHCEGVKRHAVHFARIAQLPRELVEDLALIARWHDVGKLDEPFQVLLHNGNAANAAIALAGGNPLAKSGQGYLHPAIRKAARRQAGVADGFRHEQLSVILLRETSLSSALAESNDSELVQFITGTHHGRGFAMQSVMEETSQPLLANWQGYEIKLDAKTRQAAALYRIENDWEGLFERISERYGIWGLAWIGAIFRLADHRQSANEARPTSMKKEIVR